MFLKITSAEGMRNKNKPSTEGARDVLKRPSDSEVAKDPGSFQGSLTPSPLALIFVLRPFGAHFFKKKRHSKKF